jgi:hypothetical protein
MSFLVPSWYSLAVGSRPGSILILLGGFEVWETDTPQKKVLGSHTSQLLSPSQTLGPLWVLPQVSVLDGLVSIRGLIENYSTDCDFLKEE